jgi:hypothetical protein
MWHGLFVFHHVASGDRRVVRCASRRYVETYSSSDNCVGFGNFVMQGMLIVCLISINSPLPMSTLIQYTSRGLDSGDATFVDIVSNEAEDVVV